MRFIRRKFRRKKKAATPSDAVVMHYARQLWDEPWSEKVFLTIPPSGLERTSPEMEAVGELQTTLLSVALAKEPESDPPLGMIEAGGWALLRQAALVSALREGYDIHDFDSLCEALSELGFRVKRLKA